MTIGAALPFSLAARRARGQPPGQMTLHAGWRFHQYGALEVSYLDAGPIGWDQDLVYMPEFNGYYNNRIEYSAKVTEVTVLGILPFFHSFGFTATLLEPLR